MFNTNKENNKKKQYDEILYKDTNNKLYLLYRRKKNYANAFFFLFRTLILVEFDNMLQLYAI